MSFPLICSYTDIKVFIDYEKLKDFLREHGIPEENIRQESQFAGTTFRYGDLIKNHRIIVVWIDPKWSSGLGVQSTIAHESVHVLAGIQVAQGIKGHLPEEAYAQAIDAIYYEIAKQVKELGFDFNQPRQSEVK